MHDSPMRFAAPPRRVPFSLQAVNLFNGFAQAGWLFFGFGMIFFWIFGLNADLSFATFRGEGTTTGRVTRIESTGASENDQPVRVSHYQYSVAGQTFDGRSWSTVAPPNEGAEVTVEFDPSNPMRSRIAGMRRAMFGPGALVVTIFPLVGFVFVYFATRSGLKRNHLLREGVFTTGTLIRKEPTNMLVNKRRVWELTFQFTDRSGRRCEATARTTDPQRLEDESAEPLLYDPDDPSRAYVLDEVPARPRFEHNGEMVGRGMAAVFFLIIPLLAIGLNVLVLAMKAGLLSR